MAVNSSPSPERFHYSSMELGLNEDQDRLQVVQGRVGVALAAGGRQVDHANVVELEVASRKIAIIRTYCYALLSFIAFASPKPQLRLTFLIPHSSCTKARARNVAEDGLTFLAFPLE